MTDQQLCQSSERLLKLFLDESVTNKSISLQLWFNRAGKLQFSVYPLHLQDVRIDERQLAQIMNLCQLPTDRRLGPRLALNLP